MQAFTAIGEVIDDECFQVEMTPDFHPWRRKVAFDKSTSHAPIRPMVRSLSFIKDSKRWGFPFRRGLFEIPEQDFRVIERGMGCDRA